MPSTLPLMPAAVRERLTALGPPILLAALVVVGYWRFVGDYFQGGDTWPHIWSTRSNNLGDVLKVLSEPIMAGTIFPRTIALFFRPLSSLSYAFNYGLWGMNPLAFHATDLLIHVLATLGLYALATTLGVRRWAAAVGAAVFALHPIMASVVPDLPRRDDSLAGLLVFSSLAVAAQFVRHTATTRLTWLGALLAAALLGLAEMAKEVAYLGVVLAVPTLVCAGLTRPAPRPLRRGIAIVLLFAAVTAAMLVWRWRVLGGLGGYYGQIPPWVNLDVALNDLLQNLLYPFLPLLGRTPRAWLTEIGLALLLTLVPAAFSEPRVRRVTAYGWLWLVLCGVFQLLSKSLAAWQTYLTVAGFAFLAAAVLDGAVQLIRSNSRQRVAQAALALCSAGVLVFPRLSWLARCS